MSQPQWPCFRIEDRCPFSAFADGGRERVSPLAELGWAWKMLRQSIPCSQAGDDGSAFVSRIKNGLRPLLLVRSVLTDARKNRHIRECGLRLLSSFSGKGGDGRRFTVGRVA